jgi:adenosylmethionine-8-amino-7-oxononanoate aminotransferase
LEFVKDKTPIPSHVEFGHRVQLAAFEMGVAVYPGAGTVDGIEGDHVLIVPPYTVSDAELEVVIIVLKNAYDKIVADIFR